MKFYFLMFLVVSNAFGIDVKKLPIKDKLEVAVQQRRLIDVAYRTLESDCDASTYHADLKFECKHADRMKELREEFRARYNVDKNDLLYRGEYIVKLREYIDAKCSSVLSYNKTESCSQLKTAIASVNDCK